MALWIVTAALGTAAPEGSTTFPSIVPAFPSDCPRSGMAPRSKPSVPAARVILMHTVFGRSQIAPKLILPAGWIGRGRADLSDGRATLRPGLRLQDLPNLVRLALRNYQLQSVA